MSCGNGLLICIGFQAMAQQELQVMDLPSGADDADMNLWVRNTTHPITAWYRADKGVTIATGVSLGKTRVSMLEMLTQATAANQPSYSTTTNLINFNPSQSADGTT
jgi:hypothetical protein